MQGIGYTDDGSLTATLSVPITVVSLHCAADFAVGPAGPDVLLLHVVMLTATPTAMMSSIDELHAVYMVRVSTAVIASHSSNGTAAQQAPNGASRGGPSMLGGQHALGLGPFRVSTPH